MVREDVVFVSGPEGVPGDDDAPRVVEVNVLLHVAHDVPGNGDVTVAVLVGVLDLRRARSANADVRGVGRVVIVLDRVAADGNLGVRAAGAVDQHVRGRRPLLALVALDVAAGDLEIPHLAGLAYNSAAVAVADVAAGDVDLMQVDRVEKDTDAAILVDVAGGNDRVAVAAGEVNA